MPRIDPASTKLKIRVQVAFPRVKRVGGVEKDEASQNDGVHLGQDAVIKAPLRDDPVLNQDLAQEHVRPDEAADSGERFGRDLARPQKDFPEPLLRDVGLGVDQAPILKEEGFFDARARKRKLPCLFTEVNVFEVESDMVH